MRLDRAAHIANILAVPPAYITLWLLLRQESHEQGIQTVPPYSSWFIASVSAFFALFTFGVVLSIIALVRKNPPESASDSQLQEALDEIGRLKKAQERLTSASASVGGINIPINIPISANPVQTAKPQTLPPRPAQQPVKKRSLNIGKPEFFWLRVVEGEWGRFLHFELQNNKSSIGAMLIPIYNDPNKSDVEIEYARVNLVFTNKATGQKIIIGNAWWVGQQDEDMHLELGKQHYIILAASMSGEPKNPAALENTVRKWNGMRYVYNEEMVKHQELGGDEYTVEVTVMHGGNSEFKEKQLIVFKSSELTEKLGDSEDKPNRP